MARSVAENATKILAFLAQRAGREEIEGADLATATGLTTAEINDAVTILVENGYAEWLQFLGTHPYEFGAVSITARGRYEYERLQSAQPPSSGSSTTAPTPLSVPAAVVMKPPSPVGSPYGFSDEDWEIVSERKGSPDRLYVVLGYQFTSTHYNSNELHANVTTMFDAALADYMARPGSISASLQFRSLGAGYGEHLFNEIARDIISADIAVFDTSDLNPNVMLEFGVALTWGVRVLPVKKEGCPRPPSDVSGQTWADYQDSGRMFPDADHHSKLLRMVERALRKKLKT